MLLRTLVLSVSPAEYTALVHPKSGSLCGFKTLWTNVFYLCTRVENPSNYGSKCLSSVFIWTLSK